VILASGTLAPVSAVTRQLFPGPDAAARLRHFSCGHVVEKERLLTLALGAPELPNPNLPFPSREQRRLQQFSVRVQVSEGRRCIHPLLLLAVVSTLYVRIVVRPAVLAHVLCSAKACDASAGSGPSGRPLDLRHESRGSAATLDELGRLLLNLCRTVPEALHHPLACQVTLSHALFTCQRTLKLAPKMPFALCGWW